MSKLLEGKNHDNNNKCKDDKKTILTISISRENVDKAFILDKVTVYSDKEELIERAIENVIDVLKQNGVENIEIETVNAESISLR